MRLGNGRLNWSFHTKKILVSILSNNLQIQLIDKKKYLYGLSWSNFVKMFLFLFCSYPRTPTPHGPWLLATDLGTRSCRHRDVVPVNRRRSSNVSPLLARRRLGTLSHLRSPFGQWTHLVWRLSRQVFLLEEHAHWRNQNCNPISFPLLVWSQRSCLHQGAAWVQKEGQQVVQVIIIISPILTLSRFFEIKIFRHCIALDEK